MPAHPNTLLPVRAIFSIVLLLTFLNIPPLLAQPAKSTSTVAPIPAGDIRSAYGYYSVVFYYTPDPKVPPLDTARALVKEYLPDTVFTTAPSKDAKPPFVGFEEEPAPLRNFPVPQASYFQYSGRGLTPADIAAIQKTTTATCLVLVAPRDQIWPLSRQFTILVEQFARRTGAFIWDSATRECFSVDAWKSTRLDHWPADSLPDITRQITIHLYRPDDSSPYLRAISLGMEKFALPDLVIERLTASDNRPAGNIINLVSQSLAEQPEISSGDKALFRLDTLRAAALRENFKSSLEDNATGEIPIELLPGRPSEGDPNNKLVELSFAHGTGATEDERRLDLLTRLWGSSDSVIGVTHDKEILAASQRARTRLLALKPAFDRGLPPGSRLLVKAPFPRDDEGNEWMWVEVMKWPASPAQIEGILQNDPFYIAKLKAGARVQINPDQIFDYILYREDGTQEGNETGALMQKQNPERKTK